MTSKPHSAPVSAPEARIGKLEQERRDLLLALQAKWISVKECTPEPETDVLCFREGLPPVVAGWFNESWQTWEGAREIRNVTHWQALPPRPALSRPAAANAGGQAAPQPLAQNHIAGASKMVGGNTPPAADAGGLAAFSNVPVTQPAIDYSVVSAYADKHRLHFNGLCEMVRLACSPTACSAVALDPVEGDKLPPVGSKVLIHLGREDAWVEHTVTGYYAWGDLDGNEHLHRVFVRVVDAEGYLNARLLKDVRPTAKGAPVAEGGAV